jgi:16S rRNA (guanine966-N2)-methyltransferase
MLGSLAGITVLDLFAGSGAVGLEALSRGAERAVLVESDRRAVMSLRANVAAVGLPGAQVVAADVERYLASEAAGRDAGAGFDVVFLDPPYLMADEQVRGQLATLLAAGLLVSGGVVVVERAARDRSWGWPAGLVADRDRGYGEGTLWYGRAAGPPVERPPAR